MKTADLTGSALDWAVAKIEYTNPVTIGNSTLMVFKDVPFDYHPSTNWAQGGKIIEREQLSIECIDSERWLCGWSEGATPLIAAMRCYVASQLGDDVEIPEELNEETSK